MHAEKYLIVCLQSQQLPGAGGDFWKKITVSENKQCSIFVVNAIKELSEPRQACWFNSTIISLVVCVCFFFIIVFISCIYLSAVCPLPNI